jgi:hypothetical protein
MPQQERKARVVIARSNDGARCLWVGVVWGKKRDGEVMVGWLIGWLVRTKAESVDEGCAAAGSSVLDRILLID